MGRAEEYLNQIPMWTRKKNSLEDVRDVLDVMGAPDRDIPAIHVAGTNGKGS
ncbi:MAG: bifunctional folylpolyglutamate synthase/dihydrofolate synthase, partial [Enterocloster aldenensis]